MVPHLPSTNQTKTERHNPITHRSTFTVGLAALALVALTGCGAVDDGEPTVAAAESALTTSPIRITYGADPSQFGDLRLPCGHGPHPVAVVLHGGCWTSAFGNELMDAVSEDLTEAGIATWNVEYRRILEGTGGYPETFLDVGTAIDTLRTLEHTYDLDLHNVVTVGHSAGGQLGIWAAARHKLAPTSPIYIANPLPMHAAVSLAGVHDLARTEEDDTCLDFAMELLGGTSDEVPERYAETSPIELVPIGVDQVLIHGTADDLVPPYMSYDYRDVAREAGDHVKLKKINGADHFDIIEPTYSKWHQVRNKILDAFD